MFASDFFIAKNVSLAEIDELLAPYRLLDFNLPVGNAFALKYQNNKEGVPLVKRGLLNRLVLDIQTDNISDDKETQLKIIDVLSLYANHLDQQVVTTDDSPKPALEVKQQIVLSWMEAACTVAKKILPDLDARIVNMRAGEFTFNDVSPRVLSCVSQMLHYLGKIRCYQPGSKPEERLPVLLAALDIAKYLTDLSHVGPIDDPHAYSERALTFMSPACVTMQQRGELKQAENMLLDYIKEAYELKSDFHIIQGHSNLSKFYCRNDEKLDLAIQHAESAIKLAEETAVKPDKQNLVNHPIYFNARIAAVHACLANGLTHEAMQCAQEILDDYKSNPDCGAKDHHLIAAREALETPQLAASSSSI